MLRGSESETSVEAFIWWACLLFAGAVVFVAVEFVVVKVAVYAYFKARQLHQRDQERKNDGCKVKECKGSKRAS